MMNANALTAFILVVLTALISRVDCDFIESLSFRAPFPHVYSLSKWDLQGDAQEFSDLVRLTPDSQSKRGGMWSKSPTQIRRSEIAAVLTFKISGQVRRRRRERESETSVVLNTRSSFSSPILHSNPQLFHPFRSICF